MEADEKPTEVFAEGDLGKIQGILFGAQARQFDEKLEALQTSVQADLAALEAGIQASLAAMEKRLKASMDSSINDLTAALAAEYDSRVAAVDDLKSVESSHHAELKKLVTTARRAAEEANAATGKLLENKAAELEALLAGTRDDLEQSLGRTQEQTAAKIDRVALASLFEKTASELRSETPDS